MSPCTPVYSSSSMFTAITGWTSFMKPPARAPSWQPSCSGTSPDSRRWKFPVWCSELGPAIGRLHPRSLYRSSHVCCENINPHFFTFSSLMSRMKEAEFKKHSVMDTLTKLALFQSLAITGFYKCFMFYKCGPYKVQFLAD